METTPQYTLQQQPDQSDTVKKLDKAALERLGKELGMQDIKLLIATDGNLNRTIAVPADAKVEDLRPKPTDYAVSFAPNTPERSVNSIAHVTYADGEEGWCVIDANGRPRCSR